MRQYAASVVVDVKMLVVEVLMVLVAVVGQGTVDNAAATSDSFTKVAIAAFTLASIKGVDAFAANVIVPLTLTELIVEAAN